MGIALLWALACYHLILQNNSNLIRKVFEKKEISRTNRNAVNIGFVLTSKRYRKTQDIEQQI